MKRKLNEMQAWNGMSPAATDITKIVITTVVSTTISVRKNNEICKHNSVIRKPSSRNVSTSTVFIP
jgi:hypothetical protein